MIVRRHISRGAAVLALLATAVLAACSLDQKTTAPDTISGIRMVNAAYAPVDFTVDGTVAAQRVPVGQVTTPLFLKPGTHQVTFTISGTSQSTTIPVVASNFLSRTAVAYSGSGVPLLASVLADTGGIVPNGKTKLRVANFSVQQGIEIWRTQPDFATPVHIMTPFNTGAESPYLQSTPGDWEVFVTAAGSTTRLASTGAIVIPSGQKRTVVLLDSAGVLRFRVWDE